MPQSSEGAFAIYHEHPHWFRPLLEELAGRGLPVDRPDPRGHRFDPAGPRPSWRLFFNRMSPSAYNRGGVQGMFYTGALLDWLEGVGVPTVNGSKAFALEISKARQLSLLARLGVAFPKAVVVNHPAQALEAAAGLRFPLVVKANVGGSGAGIVRYDTPLALADAVALGRLEFGVDHTALVQEFRPARDGHIHRVETLGGKLLYAIKVWTDGGSFNLCPADICQRADGAELVRSACPIDAPKTGMRVAAYQPPPEIAAACEAIAQAAGIDVGGIEYLIDDESGTALFYDVNALSNFVADPLNVVGFDPVAKLVDYLETRAAGGR